MRNKSDKLHIGLYGGGEFQGYLQNVSIKNQCIKSTTNKEDAKAYAKIETAKKDCNLVDIITEGTILTAIL